MAFSCGARPSGAPPSRAGSATAPAAWPRATGRPSGAGCRRPRASTRWSCPASSPKTTGRRSGPSPTWSSRRSGFLDAVARTAEAALESELLHKAHVARILAVPDVVPQDRTLATGSHNITEALVLKCVVDISGPQQRRFIVAKMQKITSDPQQAEPF